MRAVAAASPSATGAPAAAPAAAVAQPSSAVETVRGAVPAATAAAAHPRGGVAVAAGPGPRTAARAAAPTPAPDPPLPLIPASALCAPSGRWRRRRQSRWWRAPSARARSIALSGRTRSHEVTGPRGRDHGLKLLLPQRRRRLPRLPPPAALRTPGSNSAPSQAPPKGVRRVRTDGSAEDSPAEAAAADARLPGRLRVQAPAPACKPKGRPGRAAPRRLWTAGPPGRTVTQPWKGFFTRPPCFSLSQSGYGSIAIAAISLKKRSALLFTTSISHASCFLENR